VRLNNWPEPVKVSVKGQYAVVALRNYLGKSYNTDTAAIGKLVPPTLADAKGGNPLPLAAPASLMPNKKPSAKPTLSTATKK
jgi:hypothetical protein